MDLVEGVALASALAEGVLLDVATYLTWGVAGKRDNVEGTGGAGGVGGWSSMAFLLFLEWV